MKKVKNFSKFDPSINRTLYLVAIALIIVMVALHYNQEIVAAAFVASFPWIVKLVVLFDKLERDRNEFPVTIQSINEENNEFEFVLNNYSNSSFSDITKFEIIAKYGKDNKKNKLYDIKKVYNHTNLSLPFEFLELTDDQFEISNKVEIVKPKRGKINYVHKYSVYKTVSSWKCYVIEEKHEFYKFNYKERREYKKALKINR